MIYLFSDSLGRLMVRIPAQRQDRPADHDYHLQATPDGLCLTREDSGEVHTVTRGESGWICSCDAFRFRSHLSKSDEQHVACKHCRAAAVLDAVRITLTKEESHESIRSGDQGQAVAAHGH